jgi:membrane-associated protein
MEAALDFVARWEAWVYPALALYAAVKSGFLPIFAAAIAAVGTLDLGLVALALFGGTVFGEEAKFHIGRWLAPYLATRPRLAAAMSHMRLMVTRWGLAWVLLYRWPKGGRTLGALPLGAAGWPWPRFAALNLLGAAIWTIGMVALGWSGGAAMLGAMETWGGLASALLLAATLLFLWIGWRAVRRIP